MRIVVGEELRWWDRCYAKLLDAEPRQLEVAGPASDVRWEGIVGGKLYFGEVDEDEVAAFGLRVLWKKMLVLSHEQTLGSHDLQAVPARPKPG